MKPPITIVISQAASSPSSQDTPENEFAAALTGQLQLPVVLVPPLPDLRRDGTALAALRQIDGDLIVLARHYPRATRWLLHGYGISGRPGATQLGPSENDAQQPAWSAPAADGGAERVIDSQSLPPRHIYCLDLRADEPGQRWIDEVRRIAIVSGWERTAGPGELIRLVESAPRRWFPVIDYSRCTNCMECIDFCLFGVYGIDARDVILVEQPDNCRKGCPACSRVCPENAIMFPQHKSAAIAGQTGDSGGFKLDLSQLFGASPGATGARTLAIRERDEHRTAGPNGDRRQQDRSAGRSNPDPKAADDQDLEQLMDQLEQWGDGVVE